MNPAALHDPLPATLICLETLGPAGQADLLYLQVATHGGHWKAPQGKDPWDDQLFDIKVHGVSATGSDMDEVIRNWTRMAYGELQARAERPDGFDRAVAIITTPAPTTIPEARAACALVIQHHTHASAPLLRRARALSEALDRAEAGGAAA